MRVGLSSLGIDDPIAKRNLLIMATTWAIMGPFNTATQVYSSLFVLELGGGPVEVGLIAMIGTVVLAFSRLIGGYLADVVGRRRVLAPMTAIYGLSYLIYAFAPDWTWILYGTVLNSLALMYQPAVQAIMADTLPPEARATGITTAMVPNQITSLAGPPLATILVSMMGLERAMRLLFVIAAVATFSAGVIRLFLIETHRRGGGVGIRDAIREYLDALRLLRGDIGKLLAITATGRSLYSLSFPFAQIYAVKVLGISEEFWGVISTVTSFETILTRPLSGFVADRLGRREALAFGYLTGALGTAMLAFSPPGNRLWVLASMVVTFAFVGRPAAFALMADLTERKVRGKIIAVSGLIEGNLIGLTSGLGGVIYSTSPVLTFLVPAFGLIVPAMGALLVLPKGKIVGGGADGGSSLGAS